MNFKVFLLTILQMHGITQLKDRSLVETTCRSTANYHLCISILAADPRSATADVEGLGLIVVDAIKARTEAALSSITELRRLHPELGAALAECSFAYKAVLKADVPEAVAALTKGVPKFAEFGMSDAAWEAEICEESFQRVAGTTPLSTANEELRDLAQVANGIIKILL